jgi:hypothetical protein
MMFYQKNRIVAMEIAIVEAIDRSKTDHLGTRSPIATIHHRQDPATMMVHLIQDSTTVQVLQDFVNNARRHHRLRQVSVPGTILIHRLDLGPQEEECHHAGECGQQVAAF